MQTPVYRVLTTQTDQSKRDILIDYVLNVFRCVFKLIQFGTQVKFRWSRDHNNQNAENAFSARWYFSEMELESVAG